MERCSALLRVAIKSSGIIMSVFVQDTGCVNSCMYSSHEIYLNNVNLIQPRQSNFVNRLFLHHHLNFLNFLLLLLMLVEEKTRLCFVVELAVKDIRGSRSWCSMA